MEAYLVNVIAAATKVAPAVVKACCEGAPTPKADRDKIVFALARMGKDTSGVGPEA